MVFKDSLLALGRPALAVRKPDGSIFRDREGLAWTNPYSHDVWNYNIGIAVEAATAGIDEIQFDYVGCSLDGGAFRNAQVLRRESVALMTQPESPPAGSRVRGLGWDLAAPFAASGEAGPPMARTGTRDSPER